MSAGERLQDLLTGYGVAALHTIAKAQGLETGGRLKAALVTALAKSLADPKRVRSAQAALDPAARAILAQVQRAGGRMEQPALTDLLVEMGEVEAPRTRRPRSSWMEAEWAAAQPGAPERRAFQDVVARLELAGLLLGSGPRGYSTVLDLGMARSFVIPREVAGRLAAPPPLPPLPRPQPTRELAADPSAYSRRLFFLWSYLAHAEPDLLNSGYLSKRDLKALCEVLGISVDLKQVQSEAQLGELHFDRLLLFDLGLAAGQAGAALVLHPEGARRLWSRPLGERLRTWWQAYLASRRWNELLNLQGVVWRPRYGSTGDAAPLELVRARECVQAKIAQLGKAGDWVGLPGLMRELRMQDSAFLVRPLDFSGSRFAGSPFPHPYSAQANRSGWDFSGIRSASDGWARVEGGFVQQLLGVLGRMGLAELGLDGAGQVTSFRLSPWGRWLLARGPVPREEASETGRVVVQPTFEIVVLGPVSELKLLDLEDFADRRSQDRALSYELSRASVYRGQQRGWDGARILARLTELSAADPPQNVARSIQEWQRQHDRILFRSGLGLVQTMDAATMDRTLEAVGRQGPRDSLGLERIAPDLAVLPGTPDKAKRLAAALHEAGLPPRILPSQPPRSTLNLLAEGRIQLLDRTPDLFTRGWLQRLGERDESSDAWRLTRASARRARDRLGLDGQAQAEVWARLCQGPLPSELAVRLKAWTGHYGEASRIEGVLIELPSEEALAALAENKGLARAWRRLRPKGPLVVVDAANYDRFAEELRALGLELRERG